MKIVRLMGGLGNQMFQYAFGVLLGPDTKYDLSWFDETKGNPNVTQREYELGFWNITPVLVQNTKIFGIIKRRKYVENPCNVYNAELLKIKNGVFEGYFQVADYYESIRDRLLQDFMPREKPNAANQKILDLIKRSNSVSLHVRRGDYVKLQRIYGLCDLGYYLRAIEFISTHTGNPHFFIFSDDTQWVIDNLKIDFPYTIVDINHGIDSAWDIWLMAQCKHNIIANSSFSWWGAWLNQNPDKIVIAPKLWKANGARVDNIPSAWTRI